MLNSNIKYICIYTEPIQNSQPSSAINNDREAHVTNTMMAQQRSAFASVQLISSCVTQSLTLIAKVWQAF